ncbi:MAG TPA: type VI secretion system tip protein TssI/VgrG, partial [Polyangia bacterium]|nr:type VI secretion system tip protein TssI/VgrG [Polyangia bacterium]
MAISQEGRTMNVTSPLGDDKLLLTSLSAWEKISGLFRFDCTFVSEDDSVVFEDIIGQGVGLELEMASGEPRYFHGMVASFSQSDSEGDNVIYRAQLVPWLWFLTRSTDCRIFQKKSVTAIIEEVFSDHGYSDFTIDTASYPDIPYTVQYRETDFAFISRLMEEWGIAYYHSHSADGHQCVLYDAPSKVVECPGQGEASYESQSDDHTAGMVYEWHARRDFRPGKYALRDYTFNDPSLDLGVEKTAQTPVGGNDRFEVYDYPGRYKALGDGDKRAETRMEAEECAAHLIE